MAGGPRWEIHHSGSSTIIIFELGSFCFSYHCQNARSNFKSADKNVIFGSSCFKSRSTWIYIYSFSLSLVVFVYVLFVFVFMFCFCLCFAGADLCLMDRLAEKVSAPTWTRLVSRLDNALSGQNQPALNLNQLHKKTTTTSTRISQHFVWKESTCP